MSSDDSVVPLSEAIADYGGDHGADGRCSWSEGDDLEHEESSAQERLAWSLQQRASSRAALALELAAWPWALGPATANASGLGDGGLAALPRGDPDAWAALLRAAWLRPRLALPAAADAWARAAPWARAALAFGDVPAAAWREILATTARRPSCSGGGPGRAPAPAAGRGAAEGAGAIARVLESAVAARDAPGVRAACALAVAALRAPASAVSGNGGPRARARQRSRASSRTATATSTTTRRSSARPNGRRARPRPGRKKVGASGGGAAPGAAARVRESSAESPDEDKADEEADRREQDLLGLAARTRAPDGERAFLDKACPGRGAPLPSYAAVARPSRARASATRVVGVVFRGLDDATCAWLRDLGGAAGDLKAGRCVGLKAAALASDPACADRCATPLVASLKQRQATATMRGALGLGPAGWRLRDASAGGVSLAPRDDAEDAAEDVFVEVASSKTTRCRRGRGVARDAHALRKALARLHGACACDGSSRRASARCCPASRPRGSAGRGRRAPPALEFGGNEAWCAFARRQRTGSGASRSCAGRRRTRARTSLPWPGRRPMRWTCAATPGGATRARRPPSTSSGSGGVGGVALRQLAARAARARRLQRSDRGDTLGEYRLKLWLSRLLSDAARRAGDRDPSSAQSGDGGGGAAAALMLQMLGPNLADAAAAAACRRLADAGAVVDGEGAFPLFDAAKNGRARLAAALLEASAPRAAGRASPAKGAKTPVPKLRFSDEPATPAPKRDDAAPPPPVVVGRSEYERARPRVVARAAGCAAVLLSLLDVVGPKRAAREARGALSAAEDALGLRDADGRNRRRRAPRRASRAAPWAGDGPPDLAGLGAAVRASLEERFPEQAAAVLGSGRRRVARAEAVAGGSVHGRSDAAAAAAARAVVADALGGGRGLGRAPCAPLSTLRPDAHRDRAFRWAPLQAATKLSRAGSNRLSVAVAGAGSDPRAACRARFDAEPAAPPLLASLILSAAGGGAPRRLEALLDAAVASPSWSLREAVGCGPTDRRFDGHWRDGGGGTALHAACASGCADGAAALARAFLKHDPAYAARLPSLPDALGQSPLGACADRGGDGAGALRRRAARARRGPGRPRQVACDDARSPLNSILRLGEAPVAAERSGRVAAIDCAELSGSSAGASPPFAITPAPPRASRFESPATAVAGAPIPASRRARRTRGAGPRAAATSTSSSAAASTAPRARTGRRPRLDYRGRADAKLSFARAGAYVLRAKVLGPRGLALLKQGGRWAREAVAVSDPVAISVAAGPPETAKELTLSLRKGRVAVEDAKACARKLAEDASFLSGAAGDYRWFAEVAPATPGQAALRASSDAFKVKCSYAAEYAVFTEGPVVAGRGGRLGVAPVDRAGNVVEAHAPARVHVEVWATSVALPPDAHPRAVEMGETRANGVLELARVTAARAKVDKLGERLLADLKRERDKGALSSPRKEALLVWETVFDAAGATFADAPRRLGGLAGPHRATRELHIAVTAGPPAALDVALPKGLFECDERVRARVRVVDKLGNLCSGTHYTAFVTLELYEVREDPAKRETVTEDDADEAEHDTTQVDAPATDAPLPGGERGRRFEGGGEEERRAEVTAAAVNAAKKREKPPAKFLLGTKRQFPAVAAAKGPLGKEAAKHKGLDTVDGVADFAGVDARCAGAGAYCVVARGKVWLAGGKASVDVCGASPLFDVVNGPPAKISRAHASKAVFPPPDDRLLVAEELWTSVLPTFKVTDAAGHVVRASDAAPFTIYLTIMRCASENVDGDATERVRHAAAIAKLQEEQRLTRTWCPMLLGITAKTFKASPEGLAAFDASEELAAPLPGRYRLKASLMTRSGDMGEWAHVARCFSRPFDVVPPLDWLDDDQRPDDPAAPRTMPKENPWLANACWFHATEEEVAHITETLAKIEKTEKEIAELTERKRVAEEKTARNLDRWAAEKAAATAAGRALVDQWLERTGGKKKEYAPKPSEDRPGFKSYDPPHAGLRVDQEKQRCLALARYKFILKKDLEEVKADLKKQKALAQERKKKLPFSKPPAKTKDDEADDDFDPEEPVKHMDDLACGLIPRDVIEKLVDDPNLPGRPAAAYGACDKREALSGDRGAQARQRRRRPRTSRTRRAARRATAPTPRPCAAPVSRAKPSSRRTTSASFIRQCRQCRGAKDDKKLKHSLQVNLGGYDHVKRLAAEALVSAAERVDAILGKHRARDWAEVGDRRRVHADRAQKQMIGGDDPSPSGRAAPSTTSSPTTCAFNHKARRRHFRKLPSGHACDGRFLESPTTDKGVPTGPLYSRAAVSFADPLALVAFFDALADPDRRSRDAGGRGRDDGPAVHFDVLALYNGLRSETAAEHADHEHADRKRAKSFTARNGARRRRVSRLVRLLILGAAVYLCACLYFGAAASYGDTTAMRGGAAAAAPRALESPTAKEAAPVPENEDPRAQNKDLHAENEDLRERLAAAEASLELAKSRALEPAPRALEPARASYGDTTAMRGGAAAAPRVLTAREGRAPRSLDVYLIVAGVQKCGTSDTPPQLPRRTKLMGPAVTARVSRTTKSIMGPPMPVATADNAAVGRREGREARALIADFFTSELQQWLKRLPRRYVLNNETLDAYRRDFKPLAIAEGPKTRALEIADASGEALPWLHFEKTPSYYDCADSALMRATLPNARVAFILRDPVARLWSGYFHMHETRIRVAARRAAWTAKSAPRGDSRHWPADVAYDMYDANVSRALAADFDASLARALALRGLGADHRECLPRPRGARPDSARRANRR
ncbi:hypothetical protein JL720_16534 [Aureococcus anophagefferens]|nr:hypothetical protein JL720_16534 [Aureococcus anophagefferens]